MIIIDYEGYEDLRRIIISCCGLSFSGQGRTTQHVSLFIFSFVPNCSPKWATLQGNDHLVRWTCATIRSGYILVSIRLLIYPTKYLASNFCRTLLHKFWLLATAHYGFGKKWWFWVGRVRRCSKVSESWYRGLLVTCGHCPRPSCSLPGLSACGRHWHIAERGAIHRLGSPSSSNFQGLHCFTPARRQTCWGIPPLSRVFAKSTSWNRSIVRSFP